MPQASRATASMWTDALGAERVYLVGLCRLLSGDANVAEDLAQETLVEAWRHAAKLRDPAGCRPWLAAIARNVCLRWSRRHGRESARHVGAREGAGLLEEWPAEQSDVTVALERDDLARLLDRAMALLPPLTRQVVVESLVQESPRAEVALRLGLSEGAVAMRLQRGKLRLRRVLVTDPRFRAEAAAYGRLIDDVDGWRETRLWCTECGRRRLLGRWVLQNGACEFTLRCPGCNTDRDDFYSHSEGLLTAGVLDGVKSFKPALMRIHAWAHDFYRRGLADRVATCYKCGSSGPVLLRLPADDPLVPAAQRGARGAYMRCPSCGTRNWTSLSGLALCVPAGQRFWRTHPRIRTLPEREVEAAGVPALVTAFESVTGRARLEVVSARDSYAVLGIYGAPGE